jgi:solute carrier family 12 (sodium/potassium/chloride transporter), member 2
VIFSSDKNAFFQDPATAIPKGTLLALAISMFSYGLFVLLAGGAAVRDASGMADEFMNGTYLNCTGRHCDFGLQNSYSVSSQQNMKMVL